MIELTDEEVDKISEIVISSAESFIFSKVSKKEVIDIDISVELYYDEGLDIDVSIDVIFDDLSSADASIIDDAVDYAVEAVEKFLAEL
ncbi:MAG: DUF3194 domain-containing protein [Methanobacterium sp.]|nr:DUF3194 domain-containing protein [Methanobacterium sp.]